MMPIYLKFPRKVHVCTPHSIFHSTLVNVFTVQTVLAYLYLILVSLCFLIHTVHVQLYICLVSTRAHYHDTGSENIFIPTWASLISGGMPNPCNRVQVTFLPHIRFKYQVLVDLPNIDQPFNTINRYMYVQKFNLTSAFRHCDRLASAMLLQCHPS